MTKILYSTSAHKNSLGVTLLELLVTLILSGIIACIFASAFKDTTKLYLRSSKLYSEVKTYGIVTALMESIASDIDSHRLSLIPRMAEQKLRYVDGGQINTRVIPDDATTIIYYLKLKPYSPLLLSARIREGEFLVSDVCRSLPNNPLDEKTFIALSPGGTFEAIGTWGELSSSGCRKLKLRSGKGVVIQAPSEIELLTIHKVIEAEDVYAYLRDNKQQIRRLSFRGDMLIENQPIANHTSSYTLSQKIKDDRLWTLFIDVHELKTIAVTTPVYARLSREHYSSILFNKL